MNSKSHKRKDVVSVIRGLINNSGIGSSGNGYIPYWIANIFIFIFIITTISQVINTIEVRNDKSKMFANFDVISFSTMAFLKLYSLRGRQGRWYSLLSNAFDLEVQLLNCEDPMNVDYESEDEEDIFQKHITKYTQKYITTLKIILKIYVFTCVMYILSPFFEYTIRKIQGVDVLEYPHIFPVWTKLEKIYFPVYVITILAEAISAGYCVCIHTVFDLSMVGIMIFIHGQFLLLREYCERIAGTGRNCNISLRRDMRAHFRITRCQRLHASLIKSVNELCSVTRDVLGFCFNVITLTLCSVGIQLLSEGLTTTHIIALMQYFCSMLIELFLICYFGDAVINRSSVMLGEGPSASAWWCLSPDIRREVALLCVSMSRQSRLLAGPFHFVNLPAFIQVVRTTYSYYAVIRQKSTH